MQQVCIMDLGMRLKKGGKSLSAPESCKTYLYAESYESKPE